MKTITGLVSAKQKNKTAVFVDETFLGAVSTACVETFGWQTGQAWDEAHLEQALESETPSAIGKAVAALAAGDKTVREMETFLLKKGFLPPVVRGVLEKLIDYHYLDDRNFAENFVRTRSAQEGKKLLARRLKEKGIAPDIVEQACGRLGSQELQAAALAEKYLRHKPASAKTMAGLQRYLAYRGFPYDLIMTICENSGLRAEQEISGGQTEADE